MNHAQEWGASVNRRLCLYLERPFVCLTEFYWITKIKIVHPACKVFSFLVLYTLNLWIPFKPFACGFGASKNMTLKRGLVLAGELRSYFQSSLEDVRLGTKLSPLWWNCPAGLFRHLFLESGTKWCLTHTFGQGWVLRWGTAVENIFCFSKLLLQLHWSGGSSDTHHKDTKESRYATAAVSLARISVFSDTREKYTLRRWFLRHVRFQL